MIFEKHTHFWFLLSTDRWLQHRDLQGAGPGLVLAAVNGPGRAGPCAARARPGRAVRNGPDTLFSLGHFLYFCVTRTCHITFLANACIIKIGGTDIRFISLVPHVLDNLFCWKWLPLLYSINYKDNVLARPGRAQPRVGIYTAGPGLVLAAVHGPAGLGRAEPRAGAAENRPVQSSIAAGAKNISPISDP